jgi:hypothetical protein
MDPELERFFRTIIGEFKAMNSKLRAYELTMGAFKKLFPEHTALLDEALAVARVSPGLRESMTRRFDIPLEKFLQEASGLPLDKALKLFESMKQNGPVN